MPTLHSTFALLRRPTILAGLGLAALTGLAACADAPSSPVRQPAAAPHYSAASSEAVLVDALTRDVPLAQSITVEGKVTPGGGVIEIPQAGLRVIFPAGLVRKPTTFWATARAGSIVAYDFGPSSVFAKPVTVVQMLKGTSLWKVRDAGQLEGAYFPSETSLNDESEKAFVTEFTPTNVDLQNAKLSFDVSHFSGYMVSTGRTR